MYKGIASPRGPTHVYSGTHRLALQTRCCFWKKAFTVGGAILAGLSVIQNAAL